MRFVGKLRETFSPFPLGAAFTSGTLPELRFSCACVCQAPCCPCPCPATFPSWQDLRPAPLPWLWPSIPLHGCPGCNQPSPVLLLQGPRACAPGVRGCPWPPAACTPALTQRPPPAQPFSEQHQQDLWMQQFVSRLYAKWLVVKALQRTGNIPWLERTLKELAALNLLLCSAQAVAFEFLLTVRDVQLFPLFTKTYNSVDSCGVP